MWSPDGRRVAFLSERAGIANIYVADVAAIGAGRGARGDHALCRRPERRLVLERRQPARLLSAAGRSLAGAGSHGGEPAAVWTTPQPESHDRAVAGRRAASRSCRGGSDLVVRVARRRQGVGRGARRRQGDRRRRPGRPTARAICLQRRRARTIRHEQTPEYSGAKIIYTITENVAGREPGRAGGRRRADAAAGRSAASAPTTLARRDALRRRSHSRADFKRRTISLVATSAGGER